MEARAVVVAAEGVTVKRKVGKGVSTVDDRLDAALPGHLADSLDREDLSGGVGNVAEVDDPGARRYRLLEPPVEVIHAWRRHGKRKLPEHDTVSPLALAPALDHAWVVLGGCEDLIAGLEPEAKLNGFESLTGVSGDG